MARRLIILAGCLAVALAAFALPAMATSGGRSGIAGRAVSIVCLGTPATDQACTRHPVRATIQVLRGSAKRRIATVHSSGAGWFSVDLSPGTYQLTATMTSSLFSAAPVRTTVHANRFARVTITFVARHPPPSAAVVR